MLCAYKGKIGFMHIIAEFWNIIMCCHIKIEMNWNRAWAWNILAYRLCQMFKIPTFCTFRVTLAGFCMVGLVLPSLFFSFQFYVDACLLVVKWCHIWRKHCLIFRKYHWYGNIHRLIVDQTRIVKNTKNLLR